MKRMKKLAASAAIAAALAAGALVASGTASADIDRPNLTSDEEYMLPNAGPTICGYLKVISNGGNGGALTVDGMVRMFGAELPGDEASAARMIVASAYDYCPQYEGLVS